MTNHDLIVMDNYLTNTVASYLSDKARLTAILAHRASRPNFSIDEYVEGMVRAVLTNSVPWIRISPYIASGRIDSIFHSYSATILKTVPYMDLVNDLRAIKCGNRSDILQMRSLSNNIKKLEDIISTYGSIEDYLRGLCPTTYPQITYDAVAAFDKTYKLGGMGIPLLCEFLKNMGFLLPKPDVHLRTFFGGDRMGTIAGAGPATNAVVFSEVATLARSSTFTIPEIDLMVWSFCAKGYGGVCTKVPNCMACPFHRTNGGSCAHP